MDEASILGTYSFYYDTGGSLRDSSTIDIRLTLDADHSGHYFDYRVTDDFYENRGSGGTWRLDAEHGIIHFNFNMAVMKEAGALKSTTKKEKKQARAEKKKAKEAKALQIRKKLFKISKDLLSVRDTDVGEGYTYHFGRCAPKEPVLVKQS